MANILKKLEKEVKNAYVKSGMRNIYEKNKKEILTVAAIAATGGLGAGVGGLAASGAGGLSIGAGAALGGIAGAGVGGLGAVLKNQSDKAKDKEKAQIAAAQQRQSEAEAGLDDLIGGIRGTPGEIGGGTGGDPTFVGEPGILPIDGGMGGSGGQANVDLQRLLAEAEYQRQSGIDFAGGQRDERAQMLQEYADLIAQQQGRMLDENRPQLYEDLNTRGLLRSSELGNALGREQQKAAQILQEQVGLQGLQDRGAYLGQMQGVQGDYLHGRYGAMQRGFSLEDFARQVEAAKLTGQALQPIPAYTGGAATKAGQGAMLGGAGQLASSFTGMGKAGRAATPTTPTV
jgi:hypothetical protein